MTPWAARTKDSFGGSEESRCVRPARDVALACTAISLIFCAPAAALAAEPKAVVQGDLDRALKLEHDVLWRYFVAKRSIWLSEEMLLVDSRGSLVHATPKALRTLDGSQP